jgi:hypothetical protein
VSVAEQSGAQQAAIGVVKCLAQASDLTGPLRADSSWAWISVVLVDELGQLRIDLEFLLAHTV